MTTQPAEEDTRIPAVEIYRGVRIHNAQSPERIAEVVKPAIDRVLAMTSVESLVEIVDDRSWPPEARLLAADVIERMFEAATAARLERPKVEREWVVACVAGLDSRRWRNVTHYESLLDGCPTPGGPQAAVRPEPYRSQVERDRA